MIVAGYNDAVKKFLALDPGLPSRFPTTLQFTDFSQEQLLAIFKQMAPQIEPAAESKVKALILAASKAPGFANARTVRNIYEKAFLARANRVVSTKASDIHTFVASDF